MFIASISGFCDNCVNLENLVCNGYRFNVLID